MSLFECAPPGGNRSPRPGTTWSAWLPPFSGYWDPGIPCLAQCAVYHIPDLSTLKLSAQRSPRAGVSNSLSLGTTSACGYLQRAEIILGLYKCNYSLTVEELKLHSALWRQPQDWWGPWWKWIWVWHPCPRRSLKSLWDSSFDLVSWRDTRHFWCVYPSTPKEWLRRICFWGWAGWWRWYWGCNVHLLL